MSQQESTADNQKRYADRSEEEPTQESREAQPPVADAAAAIQTDCKKSPHHCDTACNAEKDWWNKAKPFVELGGISLLFIYTLFTIFTWRQVKKSVDEAVKAQRPYIVEDGRPQFVALPETLHPTVNISFKNVGKTPAKYVAGVHRLSPYRGVSPSLSRKENSVQLMVFVEQQFKELNAEADGIYWSVATNHIDVAPDQHSPFQTIELSSPMFAEDIARMNSEETILVWVGVERYRDSLGKLYQTDFCSFHTGHDSPDVWHYCGTHNTID
jgi:hypothetical protein